MVNLLKISLAISIIGILFLLFLTNTLNSQLTDIKDINIKHLNKKIQVQGTIINIRTYSDSNFQVLTLKDKTGKIDITLNTKQDLDYIKNNTLTITGRVTQYKDSLQIQAEKIVSII